MNGSIINLDTIDNNPDFNFLTKLQNDDNVYAFDRDDVHESPYTGLELSCRYYDEGGFLEKFGTNQNFSVMSLNIQSLSAKFAHLTELINNFQINKFKPTVICLQEIWKLPNDTIFNLLGYHEPIFKNRDANTQGGGIALYIDQNYNFKTRPDLSIFLDRILETQFIELSVSPRKKVLIGSLYRPAVNHPTLSSAEQYDQFIELFANLLNTLSDINIPVLLTGDFNLDLLKYSQIKQVTEYVDLLFSFGFLQLVMKPTRMNNNSATLIDHLITSTIEDFNESAILVSDISDHYPIFYFSKGKSISVKSPQRIRDFSNEIIQNFTRQLQNLNWDFLCTLNNTQEAYDHFAETFFDLFNIYFPLKDKKSNKNLVCIHPWFSRGLLTSRKNKNILFKNTKKFPFEPHISNYKNYRNLYNRILRESKKLYFEKELKTHQSDSRKTWQILRRAINKSKSTKGGVLNILVNGQTLTDPKLVANEFNNFFLNVAPTISSKITPIDQAPEIENLGNNPLFSLSAIPVTSQEIYEIVKDLQNKKSQDLYGLSNYFVKKIINVISDPLVHIFNLSFRNGIVPNQLKIAKIVPLFKSGDTTLTDNYRPIALLPIFSKILEKLAFNRLSNFIEGNNLLSQYQFGFRKNHSTVHPMFKLVDFIMKAWEKKEHVIGIFCDLKKAFDTVDHKLLIKKMHHMGVRGNSLEWFTNYLENRKQTVCVNEVLSELKVIVTGVPQGSILGPLLFLIYINGLPLSTSFLTLLFADDTTLMYSH
ncbi:MAG: hypothetical protein FJ333_04840 [Sphingomonadales bacterium]|nr:hypothetical protein [Sphingomonadales bacterium]